MGCLEGPLAAEPMFIALADSVAVSFGLQAFRPPPGLGDDVERVTAKMEPRLSQVGSTLCAVSRGQATHVQGPAAAREGLQPNHQLQPPRAPHPEAWSSDAAFGDTVHFLGEGGCFDDLRTPPGLNIQLGCEAQGRDAARWWAKPDVPLLCPLTRFPIALLPYPPFKFRLDPSRSSPHRLVDGKFLAMQLIVTGRFGVCGRELLPSDVSALDDYVQRCKLGPYRPGRALTLAQKAASLEATTDERGEAARQLERFVEGARAEMGKLRRIQENRLLQLSTVGAAQRKRMSSGSSAASFVSASTRASTADSDESPTRCPPSPLGKP